MSDQPRPTPRTELIRKPLHEFETTHQRLIRALVELEKIERESDARAERIEELDKERTDCLRALGNKSAAISTGTLYAATATTIDLIDTYRRNDTDLRAENAKLREAAEELVSFFPMEPEHREYLRQRHGLVFIDRLERMRQALAGKEEG